MKFVEATLQSDLPFLGLCLGGQLLAHVLGEEVGPHPEGYAEYGYYDLMPTPEGKSLFGEGLKVLQSHWHGWFAAPKGTVALGATQNFPQQAFRYGGKAFAFQFHPEATREMLQGWIARRPPGRHALPGTFLPERQLADNLVHDEALGKWFNAFLSDWLKSKDAQEAA
jgi:GMP synthase (glutamine-hydrolysing)